MFQLNMFSEQPAVVFFLFILINNEEMLNVNVTEEEDLKQLETVEK